jgi:hypothetical protein
VLYEHSHHKISSCPKEGKKVTGSKSYKYEPLPSSRHVRILVLEAGVDADPVSCQLVINDLASLPSYEALSYTWGKYSPGVYIRCGDMHIKIRPNLYAALKQLRRPNSHRMLWVDSVCINQCDLGERSSQVLLMRHIYRGAASVPVWIGPQSRDSAKAFELIRQLSALALQPIHISKNGTPVISQDLEAQGLPDLRSRDWSAVNAVFWRSWYFRVW